MQNNNRKDLAKQLGLSKPSPKRSRTHKELLPISYQVADNVLTVSVYIQKDMPGFTQKFNLNHAPEIGWALQAYGQHPGIVNLLAHAVFNNLNFNATEVNYCLKQLVKIRKKTTHNAVPKAQPTPWPLTLN